MFFMFLCAALICSSLTAMDIEPYKKIISNQECLVHHANNGNFFKAFLHARAIVPYVEKSRINSWFYFSLQAGMFAYLCNQRYFAKQYLHQLLEMDALPASSLEYKKLKASYYLAQIAMDEGNNILALQYLNTCAAISQTTGNNKQFFIIVMKELAELYNSFNNQQSAAECYRAIVALREEFPVDAAAACIDLKQISTKNTTQRVVTSFQSNDTDHGVLKI